MMDLLSKVANLAMLIFVVSSMLAMGSGLMFAQIIEPLRSVRLVAFALLANFVLMARRIFWSWIAAARLRRRCALPAETC